MKHLRSSFLISIVFLILLAACAPQTAPIASQAPVTSAPAATETPAPTPTEAPITPSLAPVVLSGPPMEVGSMWPYVDGSILVAVPGGPFTMGHGGSDNPEHTVTLSDFWIYQAKVTNQQYAFCVNAGKCKPPDLIDNLGYNDVMRANDPVVGVNWDQASSYCSFVNGTLPTEAQWEKTARGPDANIYPWGSGAPTCDYLNFNNCVGKTTNVTKYPPGQSYYRALDMEGNTYEWVNDWYNALYYKNASLQDPLGPDSGQQRSIRSSSYKSKIDQIPASTRFFDFPNSHRRDLGFRCVVVNPTFFAPTCQAIGLFGTAPAGGSSAGALQSDCPKVGIGLTSICKAGVVRVTFTDDRPNDPNAVISGVGSCTPVSVTPGVFPQVYDCSSTTTVAIESKCTSTGGTIQCASNYNLNPKTGVCEWDGTGTQGNQCLPGYTYDSANLCCTSQTSSGLNFCPVGTTLGYDSNSNPVCVPNDQANNKPYKSELVLPPDPASCTGGGNPDGGTPSTGSCSQYAYPSCPTWCRADPKNKICVGP
ncbi:MAG: SUMF1/EgtB/PvdO family nonheme iron enzyme [Chloroflexi bacterium]|nr:SUMF1/EgtB/PvdO family nonheme iron enzyme [Chloroflexota bacterium]MBI3340596.1 SUMF1/EgtB/PvdO family nonheme iron enzyme [Chloroflexota bacterium]